MMLQRLNQREFGWLGKDLKDLNHSVTTSSSDQRPRRRSDAHRNVRNLAVVYLDGLVTGPIVFQEPRGLVRAGNGIGDLEGVRDSPDDTPSISCNIATMRSGRPHDLQLIRFTILFARDLTERNTFRV